MCFEAIVQQLTKEGFKFTPQRKLLLEILFHNKGHLSAEELYEKVKTTQPNVSFGTIYRNLSLLAEMGIVNQLDFRDGRSRFEISDCHHHHLICLECGNAIDVPECPYSRVIDETASANNFNIQGHNFEVFGYCANCSKVKTNKTTTEYPEKSQQEEKK